MEKPNYSKRIEIFKKNMPCDTVILYSNDYNANIFYFTGLKGFGILIIDKRKKSVLITSKLDVANVRNKNIIIEILDKGSKLSETLKKHVKLKQNIGFDFVTLSMYIFSFLKKHISPKKSVDVSNIIMEQRMIKDSYEIDCVKKACVVSCQILEECVKKIPSFLYEYEIKNFIESEMKKLGFDVAFDTVSASKENGANPHYSSGMMKLKKGFLVIDFGAKYDGYCADITRTLYLGTPSIKEIEMYQNVLNVQKECIKLCSENKTMNEIDVFAREKLGTAYIHALGHGVGLDVHESPHISIITKKTILENTIFTIEPGVYYPKKFGIRIEDTILKTKKGILILSSFKKELISLPWNK